MQAELLDRSGGHTPRTTGELSDIAERISPLRHRSRQQYACSKELRFHRSPVFDGLGCVARQEDRPGEAAMAHDLFPRESKEQENDRGPDGESDALKPGAKREHQ